MRKTPENFPKSLQNVFRKDKIIVMDELDTSATTLQAYNNGIPVVHLNVMTINRRVADWDKYPVNDSRTFSVPENPWAGITQNPTGASFSFLNSQILSFLSYMFVDIQSITCHLGIQEHSLLLIQFLKM